jgi:hypothetical protein
MNALLTVLFMLTQTVGNSEPLALGERDVRKFEPLARAAVATSDHRKLIALVNLPLRVNFRRSVYRYYRSRAAIERNFSKIFPPEIINAMRTGPYESFGSENAMIGAGTIWLARPCHSKICYPEGPGGFRISVINQDEYARKKAALT